MASPQSTILATRLRPREIIAHVSGSLTCAFIFYIPCTVSILLPTAKIMECDVGSSYPANILWKKSIAAKYPLTVDC